MIEVNGLKIVGTEIEYGVVDDEKDEVIEFGDDLAAASTESLIFGGEIKSRKVFVTEWVTAVGIEGGSTAPDDQVGPR